MSDLVKRLRDYDTPLTVKERSATAHRIERYEAFVAKVREAKIKHPSFAGDYHSPAIDQALAELDK